MNSSLTSREISKAQTSSMQHPHSEPAEDKLFKPRILSKVPEIFIGCVVAQIEDDVVMKEGYKVRSCEAAAMRLVAKHAPSVPIPFLISSLNIGKRANGQGRGRLLMDYVSGTLLQDVWDTFDDTGKAQICRDIWRIVSELRKIPRPHDLEPESMYCTADGISPLHPLLGNDNNKAPRFTSDQVLRDRIFSLYVDRAGLTYPDGHQLPDLLPRSDKAVFCHGDLTPQNIIVDEQGNIKAILDWEQAGWWPDYWEFAMMQYYQDTCHSWTDWLERTKPEPWDITGIGKAKRVLF